MIIRISFTIVLIVFAGISVLAQSNSSLGDSQRKASYRWAGVWIPMRVSAGDGVTKLDTKIGRFIHFDEARSYVNAVQNAHQKFPGASAWATWVVSDLSHAIPSGTNLTLAQHDAYLSAMDEKGIDVYLEVFPMKGDERVPARDAAVEIEQWLSRLKHHRCVAGVGIELEYFGKATDSLAAAWDGVIKRHNPAYRMFLRHYSKDYMPPTYRGKGDLIFICDASESTIPELNGAFANWANHFSPTACAFQIGYPADEDGMDGSNKTGWWRLQDPIRDWGNSILPLIRNQSQELGLIWVTAKSGKGYHQKWDLTK